MRIRVFNATVTRSNLTVYSFLLYLNLNGQCIVFISRRVSSKTVHRVWFHLEIVSTNYSDIGVCKMILISTLRPKPRKSLVLIHMAFDM